MQFTPFSLLIKTITVNDEGLALAFVLGLLLLSTCCFNGLPNTPGVQVSLTELSF